MKHIVTILFFLIFTSTYSQTVQPCVVLEYNERLKKTPLDNVTLRIKNAGTALSDKNGECILRFRTMKPGDRVEYSQGNITRDGYEVFNKDALEQWTLSGSQKPFRINMVKSSRFRKIRDNYEAAMSKNYREQRDHEQERLMKERKNNQISQKEYELKLREIQDEYDQKLEEITEHVEKFARIDLEEMNEVEAQALLLMQEGNIEEAIKVYESLNLITKKGENKANKDLVQTSLMNMWNSILTYREENSKLNESLRKQIDLYTAMGGKANRYKADSLFYKAAFSDTTDIELLKEYYDYSVKRGKSIESGSAASIIFNHILKEYQNAPEEDIFHFFDNIEEAIEYIKNHKYSIECLEKFATNDNEQYQFHIYSKDYFTYDLINWIDLNPKLQPTAKKKILEEIRKRESNNESYKYVYALTKELEYADSAKMWPIAQMVLKANQSAIIPYTIEKTLDMALSVTNSKEVISYLSSTAKKNEKEYKKIKKTIKSLQLEDETDQGDDIVQKLESLHSTTNWLRYYIVNNLYACWYAYANTGLGKELSSYEEKLIEADGVGRQLTSIANTYIEHLGSNYYTRIDDNGDMHLFSILDDEVLFNYNTILSYYRKKGDERKIARFAKLQKTDDNLVEKYLEIGDTLKAIQLQKEYVEKLRPKDTDNDGERKESVYARNLERVFDLYVKIKNYPQAEKYAQEALDIYKKLKESWRVSALCWKLARVYEKQQKWIEAIHAWQDAQEPDNFYIARLYWEKVHDAQNALTCLKKALDDYDRRFEESSNQNGMYDQYRNLIVYTREVMLSSGIGTEKEWCEFLKMQLCLYDSYILHQEYVSTNNAHLLRNMIISYYSTQKDSVETKEFLDERAERIRNVYETNPSESMLYAYGDAVGYDYYAFYRNMHDLNMAEFYALKAADIYKMVYEKYGNIAPLANMYRELVEVFESHQNYQKVHQYSELAIDGYVKLDYHKHLLAYLYIAKAWAKFKLSTEGHNDYTEELEKGRACMKQFENSTFVQKNLILNRIDILSLKSLVVCKV